MINANLDHISIVVRNIEDSLSKVQSVLGLSGSVNHNANPQYSKSALIETETSNIELIQPTDQDTEIYSFLSSRGEGLHHLTFSTNDMTNAYNHMKINNVGLKKNILSLSESQEGDFIPPAYTGGTLVSFSKNKAPVSIPNAKISLHHITIRTEDIDSDIQKWETLFELNLIRKAVSESYQMDTAWMGAGNSQIEFAQQLNKTGPVARAIKSFGSGLHAIVLECSNSEDILKRAIENNVRVIEDKGEPVIRALHPLDFMGTLILLTDTDAIHAGEENPENI